MPRLLSHERPGQRGNGETGGERKSASGHLMTAPVALMWYIEENDA